MSSILKLDGWKGDNLKLSYIDSCLKCLEEKATKFHNDVEEINSYVSIGFYKIETVIQGSEKDQDFKLKIKVKYYGNKAEHEHKKNTHRQEINI